MPVPPAFKPEDTPTHAGSSPFDIAKHALSSPTRRSRAVTRLHTQIHAGNTHDDIAKHALCSPTQRSRALTPHLLLVDLALIHLIDYSMSPVKWQEGPQLTMDQN
jgi:hypothetical protein